MIKHCISAFKKEQREKSYKIYVTDALQAIAQNTTHYLTGSGIKDYGVSLKKRWIELFDQNKRQEEQKESEEEDTRSCSEIAADTFKRMKKRHENGCIRS